MLTIESTDAATPSAPGLPAALWFRREEEAHAAARELLAPAGRPYQVRHVSLEQFRREYGPIAGTYLLVGVQTALRWELGLGEGSRRGLQGAALQALRVAVLRDGDEALDPDEGSGAA